MPYGFGIIGCGMIAQFSQQGHCQCEGGQVGGLLRQHPGRGRQVCRGDRLQKLSSPARYVGRPGGEYRHDRHAQRGAHGTGRRGGECRQARRSSKSRWKLRSSSCDAIINACRKNNVKLSTIFPSRFHESSLDMKRAIDGNRFGRLTVGDAYVKWFRTQQYYDSGAWRGTWELDGGGALMNQAIHSVDLLTWLMGPVVEVTAHTATLAHERIAVEDTAVATLKFANGALGVIEASTAIHPGYLKRIEIHGSEGTAVMEEEDIKTWDFAKQQKRDEQIHQRDGPAPQHRRRRERSVGDRPSWARQAICRRDRRHQEKPRAGDRRARRPAVD